MNHSVCFKGHGRYVPREGWLDRGLREVKHNPRVFFENYGADALGVEPKMAKAIRYWLKCSGMIDESVRTVIRLTDLGGMILSKDPYFEKNFLCGCSTAILPEIGGWPRHGSSFSMNLVTENLLVRK